MTTTKIQNTHQERMAYVYVRQSTPIQVMENRESTERQYRLRDRAIELGWAPSRVEVIDEDQGRTGSISAHRTGFQRLVSAVGLGGVGMVLMLEASRLARNNSDWHRLIEICGISGTLIADESAVYNPREPNDRLLLGVKGTISEAELFTLRTRLYEGRWNKARKGLLQFSLPVGYVRGVAQWPVTLREHHPSYLDWGEFMKNQERLRQNWNRGGGRGVEREGNALLQGMVYCGVCGQSMSVQHRAETEKRSSAYICQRG